MNDTKKRILSVAEELLSVKGASETTIAEIARMAKVADSHAYQYFKGKEGLVFSIAEKRLTSMVKECRDQLQGILDPKSRLSKFIWYGLHYNDIHKDYVKNLVFDYRSNLEFFKTKAYQLIREYAKICMEILVLGVEQKQFRGDVDLYLVREIINGTLDAEAVNCTLVNEVEQSSENWEDIVSILLRILEPFSGAGADLPKDLQIIRAAEKVFGESSFRKSKIATVAIEAGVAEGSIYDYFKNKDDLLFSLIKLRLGELDSQMEQSFTIKKSILKLRRLIKLHFSLFSKNRNFLNIFILDTVLNRKFYKSSAYDIFRNYLSQFSAVLKEGIENGDFRQDLNIRVFVNMFIGTSIHMALRWIVFPEKSFDKLYEIDAVTDMFIAAALP